MIQENYVYSNPVSQMRQKSKYLRKHQSQGKIRWLSPLQWDFVIETAELLASDGSEWIRTCDRGELNALMLWRSHLSCSMALNLDAQVVRMASFGKGVVGGTC